MLRAILKLVAVGSVVTVCGLADAPELYAAGGGGLLLLPFAVMLVDRKQAAPAQAEPVDLATAHTTLDVIPLPAPLSPDDPEGLTVRAPMSSEEAHEMHARYAPSFDQQSAIARYEAALRDEPVPHPPAAEFDQGRYAAALQYVEAFDAQLNRQRRTSAYDVAPSKPARRLARGSVTPQQYRAIDTRSDRRASFATSPSDWEDRTIVGVPPPSAASKRNPA